MRDLGPEISIALAGNWARHGPPPSALLDPVPPEEIRRAIVAGIPFLLEDLETDTRNVLLTFARIWATVATDVISAKDEAAAWAILQLPEEHRGVLIRAREMYLDGWDEDDGGDRKSDVRAHAAYVVAEIEREFSRRRRGTSAAPPESEAKQTT
jgi:hypothetical protein